ncbi:transglutaminaseTgpA domain-containing protein [Rheinheimera sp.]|uniref:transglutaminase family protein n=1 Tax=Rheinheimera sp. TaxID=1869214 RepID=UPI0037C6B4AF
MLERKPLLLLWSGIQLSLLLLLNQAFALWVSAVFAVLMLYRLLTVLKARRAVSLGLVNILAGIIALAFCLQTKQSGVLHFMLQILLLAATARLLALQHLYEARQLVWVHYFLIASCFILHQDMFVAVSVLSVLFANLYSHYRLFSVATAKINWLQTGRAALIILPLWLGMFLLFPRLPPFWQIPNTKVATTGLSDSLDPGSIEQLVQDDSPAFRVEFTSALPAREQLYWRARLYEDFDGRSWQVNASRQYQRGNQAAASNELKGSGNLTDYSIIAEASHQRGLFALATPVSSSDNVFIMPGGMLSSPKPVSQRVSYQVSSVLTPVVATSAEEQLNLRLAPGNPQTKAFATRLKQQYPDTDKLVQALASYYSQQPFFYSLTPPRLGSNSIDAFLFDSRTGFCSHYASATAVILRHAGIAARVVGGYQGGIWYPQQGYLAVRQREAHAWVEYLHQGAWHRFDPTAFVAPERILNNLDSMLPEQERALLNSGWRQFELLQALRQQFMHLDYYWSVWVLGFNDNEQRELWRSIRRHLPLLGYALLLISVIAVAALALYLARARHDKTLPAAAKLLYQHLAPLLSTKQPQQPVSVFLQGCMAKYPQYSPLLSDIKSLYDKALYQNDASALAQLKVELKQHRRQLRRLHRAIKNA